MHLCCAGTGSAALVAVLAAGDMSQTSRIFAAATLKNFLLPVVPLKPCMTMSLCLFHMKGHPACFALFLGRPYHSYKLTLQMPIRHDADTGLTFTD